MIESWDVRVSLAVTSFLTQHPTTSNGLSDLRPVPQNGSLRDQVFRDGQTNR